LGVGTEFCVTLPLKTNKKLSIEDSVKIKNRTLLIIHDESKLGNVIRDNNSNIASDIVETNAEAYLKNPTDFSSLDIVFYIPETRLSKEKLVRVYNSFMTTNSSVFILSIDNDDNIYSLVDNVSCETNIKVSKKELTIEYISDLITRNGTPSKEVMIYNENNSNLSRMKPCFVGAHILLAEDNEINQEIVHEILTRLKIKVTIVENGKEAISALRSANNFDLVLMDCQMPEIDGYQATKIIREDPSIDRIPILALTANVLQSDSKKALDSGMDAVIHKPIVISELINTLSKWLGYDLDSLCNHVLKKVELEGSEQLQALSQLEGVDIENGLMISNGNYELYEKLLQSFSKQFANFEIRFVDKEQAARNVHTLKGASGNLGFTQVQEICLALETALRTRNTQEIDELSKLLTLKINELQSVIDEIFLPRKIKIKSFLDLQKLKNDILPLLNSYDVMGIVKIDNDYRSAIVEQLSPQDRLSFNRAMKTYNFEEIIHLIKSLDSIKE
ncbi:response regulator, partial [Vibrio sp. ER1A]|uniref:response regulator n=1 Tax=Vibrio sp. ER1A TaxID=1517681 RepID=UPI0004DD0CA2